MNGLPSFVFRQDSKSQAARFLLTGGFNTASSYLLYLAFLWWLENAYAAYSISWALGVGVSYSLNLKFTFRARHSAAKLLLFPAIYIFTYFLGLAVLHIALRLGVSAFVAPLFSIAVCAPVTFLLMRLLMKSGR